MTTKERVTRGRCIKQLSLVLSTSSNLGVIVEFAPLFLCSWSLRLAFSKITLRIPFWVLCMPYACQKRGLGELSWEGLGTLIASGCCQFFLDDTLLWGNRWGGGARTLLLEPRTYETPPRESFNTTRKP
eukprot:6456116-Amphidinium_carterae.1